MNLKIKKSILLGALEKVSKALSSKNLIPILSGIKFDLMDNGLMLTATDNDITIRVFIPSSKDLEIISLGSVIIKGKYVLDIIRKLESDLINIQINEDFKTVIFTDNSEFNLNGIDVNLYPEIDLELSEEHFNIDTDTFRSIINQTIYAASIDEARPVLTGVNFKIDGNKLECNATDSYRLALKVIDLPNNTINSNIIIPKNNLNELIKILPVDNSDIEVYIFANKIIFKFSDVIFQSRLISGNYPNIKNLIPVDDIFTVTLNKRELYNMIDRASILNNDFDNNVVTLELDKKVMRISSMSFEIGKSNEEISVVCDEKIKISFNSKYMMDALKTLSTEKITLFFVNDIKPILIREFNNDNLTCLILPIRTY